MAGVYTSLLSLTNTIDLIQNHPRHSFSFDDNLIGYLRGELDFLLEFIETFNSDGRTRSKEAEDLEKEIVFAARYIEHTLESIVVDQILAPATTKDRAKKSSSFFQDFKTKVRAVKKNVMEVPQRVRSVVDADYREHRRRELLNWSLSNDESDTFSYGLEYKLEEFMYSIREKIRKRKEESRVEDEQHTGFMAAAAAAASTSGPPATRKAAAAATTAVVGFDDYSIQLLDSLTGQQSSREISSVVGMGRSGKTTLAKTIYDHQLIVEHFDIHAWATVSQEHYVKEILLELLSCKGQSTEDTVDKLGEQLHMKLSGRRYLIVLDDIWSGEVWIGLCSSSPITGTVVVY